MGKASDWLKEERRKTLGDWVAVCLSCGFAQRYFEEWEAELPLIREWFDKFGDDLPGALEDELAALKQRLSEPLNQEVQA